MAPELRPRKDAASASKPMPSTSHKSRAKEAQIGSEYSEMGPTRRSLKRPSATRSFDALLDSTPASARRGRPKHVRLIRLSSDEEIENQRKMQSRIGSAEAQSKSKNDILDTPERGRRGKGSSSVRGKSKGRVKAAITRVDVEVSSEVQDDRRDEIPGREIGETTPKVGKKAFKKLDAATPLSKKISQEEIVSNAPSPREDLKRSSNRLTEKITSSRPQDDLETGENETQATPEVAKGDNLGEKLLKGATHSNQDSPSMPNTKAETRRSSSKQSSHIKKRSTNSVVQRTEDMDEKSVNRKLFETALDRTMESLETLDNKEVNIAEAAVDHLVGVTSTETITSENRKSKKLHHGVENISNGRLEEDARTEVESPQTETVINRSMEVVSENGRHQEKQAQSCEIEPESKGKTAERKMNSHYSSLMNVFKGSRIGRGGEEYEGEGYRETQISNLDSKAIGNSIPKLQRCTSGEECVGKATNGEIEPKWSSRFANTPQRSKKSKIAGGNRNGHESSLMKLSQGRSDTEGVEYEGKGSQETHISNIGSKAPGNSRSVLQRWTPGEDEKVGKATNGEKEPEWSNRSANTPQSPQKSKVAGGNRNGHESSPMNLVQGNGSERGIENKGEKDKEEQALNMGLKVTEDLHLQLQVYIPAEKDRGEKTINSEMECKVSNKPANTPQSSREGKNVGTNWNRTETLLIDDLLGIISERGGIEYNREGEEAQVVREVDFAMEGKRSQIFSQDTCSKDEFSLVERKIGKKSAKDVDFKKEQSAENGNGAAAECVGTEAEIGSMQACVEDKLGMDLKDLGEGVAEENQGGAKHESKLVYSSEKVITGQPKIEGQMLQDGAKKDIFREVGEIRQLMEDGATDDIKKEEKETRENLKRQLKTKKEQSKEIVEVGKMEDSRERQGNVLDEITQERFPEKKRRIKRKGTQEPNGRTNENKLGRPIEDFCIKNREEHDEALLSTGSFLEEGGAKLAEAGYSSEGEGANDTLPITSFYSMFLQPPVWKEESKTPLKESKVRGEKSCTVEDTYDDEKTQINSLNNHRKNLALLSSRNDQQDQLNCKDGQEQEGASCRAEMKNTEALNTLQAKDPSFSSKWCGERKQKKLKGGRIALGGEAVLSQWQGVENYEAGNEDGDHGECETGEDVSEGDHEEQGAGVSEGGEKVCNTQQDGKDSREEEEKDEDDEEMAKLFVKSLKTHLPRVHSFGGDSKGHEKQVVPTANSCIRKGTTKDSTGIRKRALDATVFGGGVSWSPQTGLHGNSQKHHGKQLSKPETIWQKDGQLQDGLLVPPRDPHKLNKLARKQAKDSAGAKWFDLPAPTITPELKKELQLLKLRGTIDPKRHYKAEDSKSLPKYFQVGTVVEGPADFYSGRLTKKERKGTLADELLSNAALKAYRKRKYLEIQDQKQAGGKKFWNQRKNRQKPSWAKT